MKKSTLLLTLLLLALSGCNSSSDSSPSDDLIPGKPGIPILPPANDGDNQGGDQTDPDEDIDLVPPKDPKIIEAAQRWGTTYEQMDNACELWVCDLSSLQDRIIFSIERESELIEGKVKVEFTLADNHFDFWPSFTFHSPIIGNPSIEIQHSTSVFYFNELGEEKLEGSVLLGWKTGVNTWATQHPRECYEIPCTYLKTFWLDNALYATVSAAYRLEGEVIGVQNIRLTPAELKSLFPIYDASFPDHYDKNFELDFL